MITIFRIPISFLELFLLLAAWKSHGYELLNNNDLSAAAANIHLQADDVESNEVQNDDILGFCYHKKNGLYPYNGNCSKYITCSNGYKYVMPCPNGLWFDTSANICNYPDVAVNSRCQATTAIKTTSEMTSAVTTTPTVVDSKSTSATTYQPPAGFCNGKKTGNYPEPTRCDGYIACVHGTAVFMKCPAGLYYHVLLGVCDWKRNVVCPKSIVTKPTTTQVTTTQPTTTVLLRTTVTKTTRTTSASTYKPPKGFCNDKITGNYPAPTRCDGYIACVHGKSIFMKCPADLQYNATLDICDWKRNVVCPHMPAMQTTTTTRSTKESTSKDESKPTAPNTDMETKSATSSTTYQPPAGFCIDRENGNNPDPTRCDGFIACVHGRAIFMKCPAKLRYNPVLGQCDWKYNVECSKLPAMQTTITIRSTTESTSMASTVTTYQPPVKFCNNKKIGNYPDPMRCDGYITCVHGSAIFMKCPGGLHFNPALGVCDWHNKVNCTNDLIHFHDDDPNDNKVQDDDTSDYKIKKSFCYQKENGFYAYKEDCSKYIACSNGYKYIMPCPNGLWFDTSTKTCKQPKRTVSPECSGSRVDIIKSVISIVCRNKSPGNYAYPSSCTRFIHCDGTGQGNVRMCQKESNFDPEYHVCVWNKIYPCEAMKPTTMRIPITTRVPTTSSTYQMTQKSEKPTITSAPTTIKAISQTTSSKSATTINTKTTLHSTTLTLPTTYQPPERFCNDRKIGNYPDPMRCDGYITCVHDRAIFVKCPSGLSYSPALGVCDWKLKTDCQRRSKGIILSTSAVSAPKITNYIPPGGFCTERPEGNYADPMRCDGFIVCSKNEAVFMKCPENLLYNTATGWCDYATNVKCHVNEKAEFTCKNKKEGTYKSPIKCNQYYICTGDSDMAILRTCPKHTNFHPETKACVFTFSYSCEDPTFCQEKPDGKYKNNNNCYGYYECISGRTHPRNCENGWRFNGVGCVTSVNYTCK